MWRGRIEELVEEYDGLSSKEPHVANEKRLAVYGDATMASAVEFGFEFLTDNFRSELKID